VKSSPDPLKSPFHESNNDVGSSTFVYWYSQTTRRIRYICKK